MIMYYFLSQFDSHGHNFMHKAVINEDVEAVVFLMSVRADVNSKVQNPSLNIPLHLAIKKGSEIIVRHLVSIYVHCMHVRVYMLYTQYMCIYIDNIWAMENR